MSYQHLPYGFKVKPNLMETIPAVRQYPSWKPGIITLIAEDIETAIQEANNTTEHVQIFTDGSHIEGKVGAAADLWIGNFKATQAQKHLGEDQNYTIFEAELIGIAMAVGIIWDRSYDEPVMIGTDSQAAIKALQHRRPTGGGYIADHIHSRIKLARRQKAGLKITVRWVPAHRDVLRNEQVDRGAKEAARGHTSERTFLPSPLENPPFSLAAAK
jgi:ribonuclease HI